MYTEKGHFVIQADYQHWANDVMLAVLDRLDPGALRGDEGLFFRSIHHTVDHMLLVGEVWHARLRGEARIADYKRIYHPDWRELKDALRSETRSLQDWLEEQPDAFFAGEIRFVGSDGRARTLRVRDALTHLFTHSVHHRGQISAVVTRLGGPCPEMDFVYYLRDKEKSADQRRVR